MSVNKEIKKVTTHTLLRMKASGENISMITAYDFSFARLFDAAGIDVVLVGDSASNVMAGHETTVPITLEQMIYHAQCVVRGISRALVAVDMYERRHHELVVAEAPLSRLFFFHDEMFF